MRKQLNPMTEAEWLVCTDVWRMLGFLSSTNKASNRKMRLLSCGSCRRAWHLLTEPSRTALETAELYADGQVPEAARKAARGEAFRVRWLPATGPGLMFPMPGLRLETVHSLAKHAVCDILRRQHPFPDDEIEKALAWAASVPASALSGPAYSAGAAWPVEQEAALRRETASLVRDVFGNPFWPRPPIAPLALSEQGGTVARLAQAAYEERQRPSGHLDNARLGVLADALETVSCTDAEILGHLRNPTAHVRGCWVVDLILGKE
jgi:hypothetical protein